MVKKLVILAFTDNRYKKLAGRFEAQINPEKYSEDLEVRFESRNSIDPAGVSPRYKGHGPRHLKLDFYLDGTGVLPNPGQKGAGPTVAARIRDFIDVAYEFDGSIHRSRYLRLLWGPLAFNCVLDNVAIDYTLFNPNGAPLRALLHTTFLYYASEDRIALEARKQSSDLTHYRQVMAGDTLPLMCHRIYGDPLLYIHVARRNGLDNFRRLTESDWLEFPPRDELLGPAGTN